MTMMNDEGFRIHHCFSRLCTKERAAFTRPVKMLAATDAVVWYVFPGFSLHDELELFVQAGLTPMEALQTATRNPAIYLGLIDMVGTVEMGKKLIWCYYKQTH